MLSRLLRRFAPEPELLGSRLYSEQTFYKAFVRDLNNCASEAVIESPFITSNRVASLLPIFKKMRSRNVEITIVTRDPIEHSAPYDRQAIDAVDALLDIGIRVIYMGHHHRKLAFFDRKTMWEGSLNMLSHYDSSEIMRRIESTELTAQMLHFIKHDSL